MTKTKKLKNRFEFFREINAEVRQKTRDLPVVRLISIAR